MRRQTAQLRDRLASVPVVTSSLSLMTGTLLTSALGLVFWIVAANLYDLADFGVATTSIYTMMMLADVASLGLRSGLVRFLPGSGQSMGRAIVLAYVLAAVSAALTGVVFLSGLDWWGSDLVALRASLSTFVLFALATSCWALFNLQDAVLVAQRKSPWVPIENGIFGLAKIVLLVPFASWAPGLGIFWAWTLPVFPIVIAVNLLVAQQIRAGLGGRNDTASVSDAADRTEVGDGPEAGDGVDDGEDRWSPTAMVSFSFADWISAIGRLVGLVAIPLIVLSSEGKAQAGYFNVAWLITFTVFTLSVNAGHALLAENSHERHLEQRNTAQAGMLSLVLTVPIVAVGIVGAPLILLIYGPDFADNATNVLRILLLAALPNVVYQISIGRLRSQDRMKEVIAQESVLSAMVVALTLVLMPRYGIDGVGVAWLIGLLVMAATVMIREWSTWRDDPFGRDELGLSASDPSRNPKSERATRP